VAFMFGKSPSSLVAQWSMHERTKESITTTKYSKDLTTSESSHSGIIGPRTRRTAWELRVMKRNSMMMLSRLHEHHIYLLNGELTHILKEKL
jgi:hypothetical protein